MFLIFDTETTGLPRNFNAPLSDSDNWPRMVQIAWQLHDKHGKLLHHNSIIIKPEGYTIPFNAVQVHGISTERAHAEGQDLVKVLRDFASVVNDSAYLCGHNIDFDINIIGAEFLRCGLPDFFEGRARFDTKNDQTTAYCAIPGGKGGKFKWPTLSELYSKLFQSPFEEAHNAAFDVQATSRVFFELLKRGVTRVNEILPEECVLINYQDVDLSALLAHEKKLKAQNQPAVASVQPGVPAAAVEVKVGLFSHLHNHSQYSVLQSVSDVGNIVKKAAEYNMPAIALTDHGNMYATFLFWQTVEKQNKAIKANNEAIEKGEKAGEKKNELKCIIGCELYVTGGRLDRTKQDNGYSIPLLAKNKRGYENISRLSSYGFTEGFYYVPRIDKDLLLRYKSDLIVTTGSLQGEIPSLILNVGETQAEEAFVWYKENFGEDFYVELNRHNLPEEDHVNRILLGFAAKYGVKYFAANNNYYIDKKNSESHDILLCVKDGVLKETPVGKGRGFRFGMPNDQFYFKSPAEMVTAFADLPEAIECTNEIVSKIESFKLGRDVLLPKFKIPDEFKDPRDEDPGDEGKGNRGENAYLRHLTYEGAKKISA